MRKPSRAELLAEVEALFTQARGSAAGPGSVGVELELIPVIDDPAGARTQLPLTALHPFVESTVNGEPEAGQAGSHPVINLPGGGRFTFEPGGQLEYSGPPGASASAAGADLRKVVGPLRRAAARAGIDLVDRGIVGPDVAGSTDLQVPGVRYRAMKAHFDRIGPWGRVMMCRTASMQLNLDFGPPEVASARWRLSELLVPVLGGAFANSALDLPDGTRASSARLWIWRRTDRSRTGFVRVRGSESLSDAYVRFALEAPVILRRDGAGTEAGDGRTFAEWWQAEDDGRAPTIEDWMVHLGTLFPHLRPRGWMELRFLDTPRESWWDVPLLVVPALLYDDEARQEATGILSELHGRLEEATELAAREGIGDPVIGHMAEAVFRIALAAAGRMPDYFGATQVSAAEAFFSRFTSRRRTQADEEEWAGG